MSGSSDSIPDTSFAASGSSVVVATTSCDTPSSRMRANASRVGDVGGDHDEVGDRVVLRREHVARGRCPRCAGTRSAIIQWSSKIFDR